MRIKHVVSYLSGIAVAATMGSANAVPSLSIKLDGLALSQSELTWVIQYQLDQDLIYDPEDDPNAGLGGPATMDIGVKLEGMQVVSTEAVVTKFPDAIPGFSVFGDEEPDEDGDFRGVQLGTNISDVFASIGNEFLSIGVGCCSSPTDAVRISLEPLSAANLTTSITWGGAYDSTGMLIDGTPDNEQLGTHGLITQGDSEGMISRIGVQGHLSYTATLGDADLSNGVGIADLGVILNNFGSGTTWRTGRFHGPGVVGIADLNAVLNNFGRASGVVQPQQMLSASTVVPEPSTIALAGLGMVGLVGLARRRRK